MAKKTKLSKLKKEEYFRFPGKKKVYTYDGKVRMYTRWGDYKGWGYSYCADDDINDFKEVFKDRTVEIDFDY